MLRQTVLLCLAAFAAIPAGAASYSAKLSVPRTQRIIARDISWACGSAACQGTSAESRPAVLCESLSRRAGKVDSFLVDGRAFTAAELDKCNASARASAAAALGAQ